MLRLKAFIHYQLADWSFCLQNVQLACFVGPQTEAYIRLIKIANHFN